MDYFSDQNNALRMKIPWVFFLIPLLLFGCEIINSSDPVPSYISVERVNVLDFRNEPNSAAIYDVWVSIEGKYQGTYEVDTNDPDGPLTFPVLAEGDSVEVTFNGGVIRDFYINPGRHDPYIFYEEYTVKVPLKKTEVTVINPSIGYRPEGEDGIEFPSKAFESFESTNLSRYVACSQCDIPMQKIDPATLNGGIAQGNNAAYFEIPEGSTDAIGMIQRSRIPLPFPPVEVYFEMDYNTNLDLLIGIQINGGGVWTMITLPPTEGNYLKAYIFMTDDIAAVGGLNSEYAIFISSFNSDGSELKYASFDNLRIVYPTPP